MLIIFIHIFRPDRFIVTIFQEIKNPYYKQRTVQIVTDIKYEQINECLKCVRMSAPIRCGVFFFSFSLLWRAILIWDPLVIISKLLNAKPIHLIKRSWVVNLLSHLIFYFDFASGSSSLWARTRGFVLMFIVVIRYAVPQSFQQKLIFLWLRHMWFFLFFFLNSSHVFC